MFLGCTFSAEPETAISTTPPASDIEVLTIKNAIFEEVFVTEDEIENKDGNIPNIWTFAVRLHAFFNNDLFGGNVNFTEEIVDYIRIMKRTPKDVKFQTIFERKINENKDFNINLMDYMEPVGKIEYAYVPVISGAESDYIISGVESKFDSHFLVGHDNAYPMILDVNSTETLNYNAGTIKPLSRKYPITVYNGKGGYKSGDIECLFIEYRDCELDAENATNYRNEVYNMLTDGTPKLLKDYDGNLYMVNVNGSITESDRSHMYNQGMPVTYVKSKFSWVECADAYDAAELYYNGFIDVNRG